MREAISSSKEVSERYVDPKNCFNDDHIIQEATANMNRVLWLITWPIYVPISLVIIALFAIGVFRVLNTPSHDRYR